MGLFLGSNMVNPVEVINHGEKFGLTVDDFIGDVINGVLYDPISSKDIIFSGITELAPYALRYLYYNRSVISGTLSFPNLRIINASGMDSAFYGNHGLTSVDLSSLTTVCYSGMSNAFYFNWITSVDLSSLTTIDEYGLYYAFYSSTLTSVDLSSLTTIGNNGLGSAFYATSLTSVDLSSLTTIGNNGLGSAFGSTKLTSVDLSSLTTIGNNGLGSAFSNIATLQTIYFRSLTSNSFINGDESAFNGMLNNCENVTVHFPSNLQSVIGSWSDVTNGFGGTNTTVLFDLPATE